MLKKWIFIVMMVLCGTLLSRNTFDQPLVIRYMAWSVATILLVVCSRHFRIGVIHFFAMGFLLCVLWSGLFAVNRSEWLYWALRAVLAVTFLSVVEIDEKLLAKTMMCLGVVFFVSFWLQYYQCRDFDNITGLMRQKNYFAAAHFFVIPFCYYALRFWKKTAIVIMLMMVVNIVLLRSRSGACALFVAAVILALLHRKLRWYIVGTVIIGGICFAFSDVCNFSSFHQRTEQWVPTLRMICQNPWGVGAGNWWIVFPKYAPAIDFPNAYSQVSFRFPHNDFLWVWAETGIFGIFFYLGMFGVALWSAIKKKANYLIIAICGYMTMAFFMACRERPFASLMMMVFIVLACDRKDEIKCYKEVLIPLTLLLVVLGFQYRSLGWVRCMYKVKTPTNTILATEGYSPFTTLTYTGVPYHWWRAMMNYKLGNKELAMRQFEIAYKYNPYNVHVLNGMGIASIYKGEPEQARVYLNEALRICPDFVDARDNLEKLEKR